MVLLHVVLPSQLCLPDKHSSMSVRKKKDRFLHLSLFVLVFRSYTHLDLEHEKENNVNETVFLTNLKN